MQKLKLPSASNLAFWKKDSDTVPPPPPSRHLNPAFTGETESMVSQSGSSEIDIDEYRRKIDQMQDSLAAAQSKLDFGSNKAIRKPYGDGSAFEDKVSDLKTGLDSRFKTAGNSIDASLKAAQEKASTFGTNSLSKAQQSFDQAIADAKKTTGRNDFRTPADVLSTKPANDFKQALAKTQSQLKSGIDAAKKKTGFDRSLAKVNQSLYDMNGQLTTAAPKASNAIGSSVDAARQQFSNAMGAVSDGAVAAAKSTSDFGGNIRDKIASAASDLQPTFGSGDNSFKPAFKAATQPVKKGAQNLINQAKDRVAGLGGGFAKPQPPKFAPAATTASSGGEFGRSRVANVTQVKSPSSKPSSGFPQKTGLNSSLTKAWNNGAQQSQLKPIEVGTSASLPGNGLRTASAQSNRFGSSATASTIPAAFEQNRNAMASHVSEIDIPEKILSGTGSYAPGSVNKVR